MDFRMAVKIYYNFICEEFSVVALVHIIRDRNTQTQTIDEQDALAARVTVCSGNVHWAHHLAS